MKTLKNFKAHFDMQPDQIIWIVTVVRAILEIVIEAMGDIDWKSYIEQVETIFRGEFDYGNIQGENGPLVYPAGHVYQFMIIYYLTLKGDPVISLFLFLMIYFIMMYVIFKVYDSVFPKKYRWVKIFCAISTPVQKATINHRFNDSLAMIPLYLCLYFLITNKNKGSPYYASLFYAFALSTKTNVLLFLPGLLYIFIKTRGPIFMIIQFIIIVLSQFIIGYPFIRVNATNYFGRTYDSSRNFLYSQSMNWQFVPEDIFQSRLFHISLLVLHLLLLAIFLFFKWEKISFNIFKDVRLTDWSLEMKFVPLNKIFILRVMFICNFIGILCFRSLHYQFILWFYTSLPFMLWQTKFNDVSKGILLLSYEYAWSYNRAPEKSLLIFFVHLVILFSLFFYDINCNKISEIEKNGKNGKNGNKDNHKIFEYQETEVKSN